MKKRFIVLISLSVIIIISSIIVIGLKVDNDIGVLLKDNKIYVKHKLTEDENIIVIYSQNRNNDFFDMSQFIVQDINAETDDFTGEMVMSTATDFISPYGLLAVNNKINDKGFTVGGAHATKGSEGMPTGRFSEIEYITLDNEILSEDGLYEGQQLDFKVNQFVYASNIISDNNARDSLLEERVYSISGANHEVEVKLTALEDIVLTRYAGLQMTQPDFYDFFYFPGLDNKYEIKGEAPGLYTLNKKSYEMLDRAVLYNDKSMLIMKTDREYGIGNGEYAPKSSTENPQSPLTYSGGKFGKIYSHNLGRSNAFLKLDDAESVKYRGGYYFREFNSDGFSEVEYDINGQTFKDNVKL